MIKRYKYDSLKKHLSQKEITIIIGPRQVGKTTMMKMLVQELKDQKVPTLFLNLDIEADSLHVRNQSSLIGRAKLEFGEDYGVVFIDEIQRKENAGLFLKGIYDMDLNLKIVVSGSGSLELKEKLSESLAGRKRVFEIFPVTFREFVDYKTNYQYSNRIGNYLKINVQSSELLFNEYVIYGGYPAVITASVKEEKRNILSEIISAYIQRDIREILSITHVNAYAKLISVLAQQTSYPIKYTSLSQYINVSSNTVKDYIWYLKHTFILRESKPFFTNPLKEIIKEPCIYFIDLGILNYHRNNLFPDFYTPSFGMVFQNFIFNELCQYTESQNITLKYWRTKEAAEVDIVIEIAGKPVPMEIKYTSTNKVLKSRSLQSFIKKYEPRVAYFITSGEEFSYCVGNTNVLGINFLDLGENITRLGETIFGDREG